ncbi:hypothetical protein [Nonomuraea fuscirosea]|uniref:hypothetical protein n=1 Tax=Nonomuraea fuscirosea TaxID=1291556 RepID=UPI0033E19A06
MEQPLRFTNHRADVIARVIDPHTQVKDVDELQELILQAFEAESVLRDEPHRHTNLQPSI